MLCVNIYNALFSNLLVRSTGSTNKTTQYRKPVPVTCLSYMN